MAGSDRFDPVVLAIDQGTTNTKALLVSGDGTVLRSRSGAVPLTYPRSGWVEQSAEVIWGTVAALIDALLADGSDVPVAAVALSNQRETVVLWNRRTGEPVCPAITWQCRRSAVLCQRLREAGHEDDVARRTGLGIDTLFPAAKIAWMLDEVPGARDAANQGDLLCGTIDSWMLWKLTNGEVHATDHGNAARTQLFNLETGAWDPAMCALFDVPMALLPCVMPSDSCFGTIGSGSSSQLAGTPVHAVMGDSHAALYAHESERPGAAKVTIGTGSSLMAATAVPTRSAHGLSTTIAWSRAEGGIQYALEGNISVSGHAAAFAAEMMGLKDVDALSDLAEEVADTDGVTFVPALAGLGAPHWQSAARGTIGGMTLATRPAHLARAALEAIAHQICDVVESIEADLGHALAALSIDGAAARNAMLARLLADFCGRTIMRPDIAEASALGVARMAAEATGIARSAQGAPVDRFRPAIDDASRKQARASWKRAVANAIAAA